MGMTIRQTGLVGSRLEAVSGRNSRVTAKDKTMGKIMTMVPVVMAWAMAYAPTLKKVLRGLQ